ncbi:phosphotransferase [Actinoplanes sp. HUAS TT8]|uniref:phosphotransferase family protein n=1 Tax=Actinoplanes sp. HUAS TT8 TaxID=3447453 RepID=UPI003F527E93
MDADGWPALPAPVQGRLAEAVAGVPGLTADRDPVLRLTDKAVTVVGGYHGRAAVIKVLLAGDGYWRDRFEHETLLYRAFAERRPAFTVPNLYFTGPGVLVVQRLPGRAAHTDRYPPPLPAPVVQAMLTRLLTLGNWQPPGPPAIPGFNIAEHLTRATASGGLTLDDAALIRRILREQPVCFAHGDPLASNFLADPDDTAGAWIDFEHAGPHPPGADLALLGVLLGRHDQGAAVRCREIARAAGWAGIYTAMRMLWLARERRLYRDVFGADQHRALIGWLDEQAALTGTQLRQLRALPAVGDVSAG